MHSWTVGAAYVAEVGVLLASMYGFAGAKICDGAPVWMAPPRHYGRSPARCGEGDGEPEQIGMQDRRCGSHDELLRGTQFASPNHSFGRSSPDRRLPRARDLRASFFFREVRRFDDGGDAPAHCRKDWKTRTPFREGLDGSYVRSPGACILHRNCTDNWARVVAEKMLARRAARPR